MFQLWGCRYSFGDVRHPSPESAALVEEIVHKQMTEVVSLQCVLMVVIFVRVSFRHCLPTYMLAWGWV